MIYIKESGDFVVNLPNSRLVREVDYCGVRSGKLIDKIREMNFTIENSKDVTAPIISECFISLECKVKSITNLGSHDLFLAEIVNTHVDNTLIDTDGKIHFEKADLITYSHGEYFSVNSNPLGKFGYSVQKKNNKGHSKHKKKVLIFSDFLFILIYLELIYLELIYFHCSYSFLTFQL